MSLGIRQYEFPKHLFLAKFSWFPYALYRYILANYLTWMDRTAAYEATKNLEELRGAGCRRYQAAAWCVILPSSYGYHL